MLYAVCLLYKSTRSPASGCEPPWDTRVSFVVADSEDEARAKGGRLGRSRQSSYQAHDGTTVRWVFDRVHGVRAIDRASLEDGAELFSIYMREWRSEMAVLSGSPAKVLDA